MAMGCNKRVRVPYTLRSRSHNDEKGEGDPALNGAA
jgi:hypothetical protein